VKGNQESSVGTMILNTNDIGKGVRGASNEAEQTLRALTIAAITTHLWSSFSRCDPCVRMRCFRFPSISRLGFGTQIGLGAICKTRKTHKMVGSVSRNKLCKPDGSIAIDKMSNNGDGVREWRRSSRSKRGELKV
jgi:hypothetical protein